MRDSAHEQGRADRKMGKEIFPRNLLAVSTESNPWDHDLSQNQELAPVYAWLRRVHSASLLAVFWVDPEKLNRRPCGRQRGKKVREGESQTIKDS